MISDVRSFWIPMKMITAFSPLHSSDNRFSFWIRVTLLLIPSAFVLSALFFSKTSGVIFEGIELWRNIVLFFFVIIFFGVFFRAWSIRFFFDLLVGASLLFGVWVFLGGIFPWEVSILIASIVTLIQAFVRRVFVYDFIGIVGISGLSLLIVSFLSLKTLSAVFVAWLIYDIVVKRDVSLEIPSPIYRGYIPVIFFPKTIHGFLDDVSTLFREKTSDMITVGEVLLPTVFVAGAGIFGLWQGVLVVFGLAMGIFASTSHQVPLRLSVAMLLGSGIPFFVMIFLHRFV